MSFNAPRREEYDGAKISYLSFMDNFFFRKIVIDKTRSFDLTRDPPGSPTEHASPGGGVISPPLLASELRIAEKRARRRSKALAKTILIST